MSFQLGYFFALGSSLSFALASIAFQRFALLISPIWMNAAKTAIGLFVFTIAVLFNSQWPTLPYQQAFFAMLISGLIGLTIGDIFLFIGYTKIGSGRTLMIFSFQPLFIALFGWLLLGQGLTQNQFLAIIVLMMCLIILSIERFQIERRWDLSGLGYALLAVALDSAGTLLTRWGFDLDPQITVSEGNFYRFLGAGIGFVVLARFIPVNLFKNYKKLNARDKGVIWIGSLFGTVLALFLWLLAIRVGNLAAITALGGTGPLFATFFECVYRKQWPSSYQVAALIFFGIGFSLLVL
jgi:drug/metabolite transporter (DMT)-like permease